MAIFLILITLFLQKSPTLLVATFIDLLIDILIYLVVYFPSFHIQVDLQLAITALSLISIPVFVLIMIKISKKPAVHDYLKKNAQ